MRYFKGRAPSVPAAFNSGSDDEDGRTNRASSLPRPDTVKHPPRRPRLTARVVATHQPSQPENLNQRPTTSSFVPVNSTSKDSGTPLEQESSSSSASSSSSSSEQSSDEDLDPNTDRIPSNEGCNPEKEQHAEITVKRPVFIQQNLRASKQSRKEEVDRAEEREILQIKRRQQEAKRLVSHVLEEEERRREFISPEDDLPDDVDKLEFQEADYALWKVRELLRVKRDRDEQNLWENRGSTTTAPLDFKIKGNENPVEIQNRE